MKTEEIVDAARNAGFSSSEITHRLAAFKRLIQYSTSAEREKCTGTQEFMTLPREVVELALEAWARGCPPDCKDGMTDSGGVQPWGEAALIECPSCQAVEALRAALEQPQAVTNCHQLEQPQVEQEPYAWHYKNNGGASVWHMGPSNRLDADIEAAKSYPKVHQVTPLYLHPQPKREPVGEAGPMPGADGFTMACFRASDVSVGTKLYTNQQPKQEPLTDEEIDKLCPQFDDPMRREMWIIGFRAAHNIK